MLVAIRTAGGRSYINFVERIMSLLNICLQDIALARAKMSDESEKKVHKAKGLKGLRALAASDSVFVEEWKASFEPSLTLLAKRFGRMSLKGEQFTVLNEDIPESEILELGQLLLQIDPSINLNKLQTAPLQSKDAFQTFVRTHVQTFPYMFVFRSCHDCKFCETESRLSPATLNALDGLHPPPLPRLTNVIDQDLNANKYKGYADVYGQPLSSEDQPSLKLKGSKMKKSATVQRVRGFLKCTNCAKPRCIYSMNMLPADVGLAVNRVVDSMVDEYTCGESLDLSSLSLDEQVASSIFMQDDLRCAAVVESTYHAKSDKDSSEYPFACTHCGTSMGLDWKGHSKTKTLHQTVRPKCLACSDKPWITWKSLRVEKPFEDKAFDDAKMPSHRPIDHKKIARQHVVSARVHRLRHECCMVLFRHANRK